MNKEQNWLQWKEEESELKNEISELRLQISEMKAQLDKANAQLQEGNIPNVMGSFDINDLYETYRRKLGEIIRLLDNDKNGHVAIVRLQAKKMCYEQIINDLKNTMLN